MQALFIQKVTDTSKNKYKTQRLVPNKAKLSSTGEPKYLF